MICGVCKLDNLRGIAEFTAHLKVCARGPDGGWIRVVALKEAGREETARELAASLMGVEGPKMTEEQKEALRAYSATPEAKERARERRENKRIEAKVAAMKAAEEERRKHGGEKAVQGGRSKARSIKRKR